MRINKLIPTVVLALGCVTMANADTALVLGGTAWDESVAIRTELAAQGHTVTYDAGSSLPADISSYNQVWDLRVGDVISASDTVQYDTFLKNDGYLYLAGENNSFATRNNSISTFTSTLGGGTITVGGSPNNSQSGNDNYFSASTSVSYVNAATVTSTGGRVLTADGTGKATGKMWIGRAGDLGAAYTGTVVVIADINWTQAYFFTAANDKFLEELIDGIAEGTTSSSISASGTGNSIGTPAPAPTVVSTAAGANIVSTSTSNGTTTTTSTDTNGTTTTTSSSSNGATNVTSSSSNGSTTTTSTDTNGTTTTTSTNTNGVTTTTSTDTNGITNSVTAVTNGATTSVTAVTNGATVSTASVTNGVTVREILIAHDVSEDAVKQVDATVQTVDTSVTTVDTTPVTTVTTDTTLVTTVVTDTTPVTTVITDTTPVTTVVTNTTPVTTVVTSTAPVTTVVTNTTPVTTVVTSTTPVTTVVTNTTPVTTVVTNTTPVTTTTCTTPTTVTTWSDSSTTSSNGTQTCSSSTSNSVTNSSSSANTVTTATSTTDSVTSTSSTTNTVTSTSSTTNAVTSTSSTANTVAVTTSTRDDVTVTTSTRDNVVTATSTVDSVQTSVAKVQVTGRIDQLATVQDITHSTIRGVEFSGLNYTRSNHSYNNGMTGSTNTMALGGTKTTEEGYIFGGGYSTISTSISDPVYNSATASTTIHDLLVGKELESGRLIVGLRKAKSDYTMSRTIGSWANSGATTETDNSIRVMYSPKVENKMFKPVVGYTNGNRNMAAYTESGSALTARSVASVSENYSYATLGGEIDFGVLSVSALHYTDGITDIGVGINYTTEEENFTIDLNINRTLTSLGDTNSASLVMAYMF